MSVSSENSTAARSAWPASRLSVSTVKRRFSAAGPGKRSSFATMVHADTHMPQPMHSIAGSMRCRSGAAAPMRAKAAGSSFGTKVAPTRAVCSASGARSTTRSRMSGKW